MQNSNKKKMLLGLVGYPLKHSLSSVLHKFLLREIDESGDYQLFEAANGELAKTVTKLKSSEFAGFNVTIPYKQPILSLLDDIDPQVKLMGSVNTVTLENNLVKGYNTDVDGFLFSLQKKKIQLKKIKTTIFGAGGVARAIVFTLIQQGVARIDIVNRNTLRAKSLANDVAANRNFENIFIHQYDEAAISKMVASSQLIINATSVGMWPDVDTSPYIFKMTLSDVFVFDSVYNPINTKFLTSAKQAGARVIDGLDMFIFQGAASMRIWLKREEPIQFDFENCRRHLINHLQKYERN